MPQLESLYGKVILQFRKRDGLTFNREFNAIAYCDSTVDVRAAHGVIPLENLVEAYIKAGEIDGGETLLGAVFKPDNLVPLDISPLFSYTVQDVMHAH